MNVLLLYNARETYTNAVFEHVDAFRRHSAHRYFFAHHDGSAPLQVDLARFDAVVIHYCTRLPYDQVSEPAAQQLAAWPGLKVLFIQDEYEHTHRAWHWIRRLGIQLVFTVVPEPGIARIYPPAEFPGVRFVSNLTGYVPEHLPTSDALLPPSRRELVVGYRGRPLPLRFGELGAEKVGIGRLVKAYCEQRQIRHDIEWAEEARIYGPQWYEFMASCRAMLGTESGSNVFDWDGTLARQIREYREQHPAADDSEVHDRLVRAHEQPGLMNQISPRVFEAISLRTALVQFEGTYSGVIEPWTHYLPLKKDGSNLDEVFAVLADGPRIDEMVDRAWRDVIVSGRYSYQAFVRMTDAQLEAAAAALPMASAAALSAGDLPAAVTTRPLRAQPPKAPAEVPRLLRAVLSRHHQEAGHKSPLDRVVSTVWGLVPEAAKRLARRAIYGRS